MKSVLVFLGILALVWGQTTNVQTCLYQGNAATFPINTHIAGCVNPPCSFAQLEYAQVQVIFQSPRRIHSMLTRAYAYIVGPIGAPYGLGDQAVTCNFLSNSYCPLQTGEVVVYNLSMFVESWMPEGTSVTIEFVIVDEADGSTIACIRTPIVVTGPVAGRANSTLAFENDS